MKVPTPSSKITEAVRATGLRFNQRWTFARLVAVGLTASVTYGLLFLILGAATTWSDVMVNVAATAASTVLRNELHRRFTFPSTGAGSVARGQSTGPGRAIIGLILNSVALAGWNALAPGAGAIAPLAVVYGINGLIGLANFAALRHSLTGPPPPRRHRRRPGPGRPRPLDSHDIGRLTALHTPTTHRPQGQMTMTSQPDAGALAVANRPDTPQDPMTELAVLDRLATPRAALTRLFLEYRFGIEEVLTKVRILQEEFVALHEYNPIEHVTSRLKTSESLLQKLSRKGCEMSLHAARASITDIAGLRVSCSFVSDAYRVADMLIQQPDLAVLEVRDYIAAPKPNGYRSLHLLVTVPVFLSSSAVHVPVEIQIRTVAMDFWASTEHKIHYKYRAEVPGDVRGRLSEAAETAHHLDVLMEQLHRTVHGTTYPGPAATNVRV